jgi:diadenylate cyclase
MSREVGTRHRAAVGVTEESDAVAIIVSEETGTISLAVGDTLERGLTGDMLKVRLEELLGGRRLRRLRRAYGRSATT